VGRPGPLCAGAYQGGTGTQTEIPGFRQVPLHFGPAGTGPGYPVSLRGWGLPQRHDEAAHPQADPPPHRRRGPSGAAPARSQPAQAALRSPGGLQPAPGGGPRQCPGTSGGQL